MNTQIDATAKWKVNCEGYDITEFMQAVSSLYKGSDYLDRVNWHRSYDDDDMAPEDVAITVDTFEDVALLLPLAIKCGYNYSVSVALQEAGKDEYDTNFTAWASLGTRQKKPSKYNRFMVRLGADAGRLAARIRNAMSALNGGGIS